MKKLYRTQSDAKLAGVCGGIGRYFNIDPTLIRLIMIVATFMSIGTAILAYVVAAFMIPLDTYDID